MSDVHDVMPLAKTILSIDLGKFKSVACVLDAAAGEHRFETIPPNPAAVHDLLVAAAPGRLVIEACSVAGWVHDLAVALSIPVQVANTNGEAWHYKRVKRKTDRDDALKLTKLSLLGELPVVHMPPPATRQWKSLIKYRHALVDRRTGIKNTIRSLLDAQGLSMPGGQGGRGWTDGSIAELKLMSKKLADCGPLEFWKGQLEIELRALSAVAELIGEADDKLNAIGAADERVRRLRTIPQVGPRLAELVVSTLGDPKRFKNAGQVSAYAGLVPKQFQSGEMNHQGRITGQGSGLLRRVLVPFDFAQGEVAWGMQRREGRGKQVFDRLCHGQKTRRKQAVVALSRKILVWCWAMLRDGTEWADPTAAAAAEGPGTAAVAA